MRKPYTRIGILASISLAAGCSSGQSDQQPAKIVANVATYKAQLAVGVATFVDGSTGLNVVTTFRQPDGLTATLLNTPTISGPAGFLVPAGEGGVDGGTAHISASPQVAPAITPLATTLGTSGGVFGYGLAPDNSDTSGSLNNNIFDGAFYDDSGTLTGSYTDSDDNTVPVEFRGGPPAYPNVDAGTYPSGFLGFTQGFVAFDAPPVMGTYAMSILVPAATGPGTTVAATPGTLSSTTGSLGPIATAPIFTEDGAGGGVATCTVPTTATETLVDISDIDAVTFYTVVVTGGGAISATFTDALGPVASNVAAPTIPSGDEYEVSCIAVNYPVFEAGPPSNRTEVPTIVGSNGQADISFSPNLDALYGGAAATSINHRSASLHHRAALHHKWNTFSRKG